MPSILMFCTLASLFAMGYFWVLGGILAAAALLVCTYATILSRQKKKKIIYASAHA
jgi:hypothetical protein